MKPIKTLVDEAFSAATGTAAAITLSAVVVEFAPELALFSGLVAVFFSIVTCVKLAVVESRLR